MLQSLLGLRPDHTSLVSLDHPASLAHVLGCPSHRSAVPITSAEPLHRKVLVTGVRLDHHHHRPRRQPSSSWSSSSSSPHLYSRLSFHTHISHGPQSCIIERIGSARLGRLVHYSVTPSAVAIIKMRAHIRLALPRLALFRLRRHDASFKPPVSLIHRSRHCPTGTGGGRPTPSARRGVWRQPRISWDVARVRRTYACLAHRTDTRPG